MRTPGPWCIGELDNNGQRIINGPEIELATLWHHCVGSIEKEMEANAAFIVEACNNYESLQARCDRYKAALESIAANTCCGPCQEAKLVARTALEIVNE